MLKKDNNLFNEMCLMFRRARKFTLIFSPQVGAFVAELWPKVFLNGGGGVLIQMIGRPVPIALEISPES